MTGKVDAGGRGEGEDVLNIVSNRMAYNNKNPDSNNRWAMARAGHSQGSSRDMVAQSGGTLTK